VNIIAKRILLSWTIVALMPIAALCEQQSAEVIVQSKHKQESKKTKKKKKGNMLVKTGIGVLTAAGILGLCYTLSPHDTKSNRGDKGTSSGTTGINYSWIDHSIATQQQKKTSGLELSKQRGVSSGALTAVPNAEIVSEFFQAVGGGNISSMTTMLSEYPTLISTEHKNMYVSHQAIKSTCAAETIQFLLKRKADVNAQTTLPEDVASWAVAGYGYTALHLATYRYRKDIVDILLRAKADVNIKDSNQDTALHYAALAGEEEIVKQLLQAKASIDVPGINKNTPLHSAALQNRCGVAKILLEAKADTKLTDKYGATAYAIACERPHQDHDLIRLLDPNSHTPKKQHDTKLHPPGKELGQDLIETFFRATIAKDMPAVQRMVQQNPALGVAKLPSNGVTAVHYAAGVGSLEILEYLLESKAEVNAQDNVGMTPLHVAAQYAKLPIIELLVKNNAQVTLKTCEGDTPLHRLVPNIEADASFVECLLNAKASLVEKNEDGKTPFDLAMQPCDVVFSECVMRKRNSLATALQVN